MKKSIEYTKLGYIVDEHQPEPTTFFANEPMRIFLIKSVMHQPFFLAELGDLHAQAETRDEAVRELKKLM